MWHLASQYTWDIDSMHMYRYSYRTSRLTDQNSLRPADMASGYLDMASVLTSPVYVGSPHKPLKGSCEIGSSSELKTVVVQVVLDAADDGLVGFGEWWSVLA